MILGFVTWGDQRQIRMFGGDLECSSSQQRMSQSGLRRWDRTAMTPRHRLGPGVAPRTAETPARPALPPQPAVARWGRCDRRDVTARVVRPSPSTDAASSSVRDKSSSSRIGRGARLKTREAADHSSSTRATDRARQGASRSTTDGDSSSPSDECAAVELHLLTVIQSQPEPVRIELRRVRHRVSTLQSRVGDQGRGQVLRNTGPRPPTQCESRTITATRSAQEQVLSLVRSDAPRPVPRPPRDGLPYCREVQQRPRPIPPQCCPPMAYDVRK